jgi:hypothetical protein
MGHTCPYLVFPVQREDAEDPALSLSPHVCRGEAPATWLALAPYPRPVSMPGRHRGTPSICSGDKGAKTLPMRCWLIGWSSEFLLGEPSLTRSVKLLYHDPQHRCYHQCHSDICELSVGIPGLQHSRNDLTVPVTLFGEVGVEYPL